MQIKCRYCTAIQNYYGAPVQLIHTIITGRYINPIFTPITFIKYEPSLLYYCIIAIHIIMWKCNLFIFAFNIVVLKISEQNCTENPVLCNYNNAQEMNDYVIDHSSHSLVCLSISTSQWMV